MNNYSIKLLDHFTEKTQSDIILAFYKAFLANKEISSKTFLYNINQKYKLGGDDYKLNPNFPTISTGIDEAALNHLFQNYCNNTDLNEVLIKVISLVLCYSHNPALISNKTRSIIPDEYGATSYSLNTICTFSAST